MNRIILSTLLLFSISLSYACLWDRDTYAMEKERFPTVKELISGQFLRHSPEFYKWRIENRKQQIAKYPKKLSLYDDLAVAYCKLDRNKEAIAVALKKESIQPGLYETYANLGTFYLHDRQIEKGITYIKKALEINPDAHFGRERYQLYLAEYLLNKMKNGTFTLPLAKTKLPNQAPPSREERFTYAQYLNKKVNEGKPDSLIRHLTNQEIKDAVKGVSGMMKFGNYDSPILLEVLSQLLSHGWEENDANILASMALIKSAEDKPTLVKQQYYKRCADMLSMQIIPEVSRSGTEAKIIYIDKLQTYEVGKGNSMYQSIRSNEIKWIEAGLNPEVEFEKMYYKK